jgi:hypothetical protein
VAADLTPLEQAAARVGLPGLKARVVPHDRRRGGWFRWRDGELLVSDRVIDRCPPEDACALLVDEVLVHRKLRGRLVRLLASCLVCGLLVAALARSEAAARETGGPEGGPVTASSAWYSSASLQVAVLFGLGIGAWWWASRTASLQAADDQTVGLLGDATPLVRGLNEMNFEEIHLAGKVLPARPDLHRRAERLVAKYRLCDAQPE